jgi:hypothetical protein
MEIKTILEFIWNYTAILRKIVKLRPSPYLTSKYITNP